MIKLSKHDYELAANRFGVKWEDLSGGAKAVFMRLWRTNCMWVHPQTGTHNPCGIHKLDSAFDGSGVYILDATRVVIDTEPITRFVASACSNTMMAAWKDLPWQANQLLLDLGRENCEIFVFGEQTWYPCKGDTFHGDGVYRLRPDYPVKPEDVKVSLCVPYGTEVYANGKLTAVGALKAGDVLACISGAVVVA